MLENIFLKILNMSFIGSFVILFVMLIRLFLKKSPKIFSYLLWGVVLFRLLCPFSFESIFSLLPAKVENIADNITYSQSVSIPTPQIFSDITPPEIAANGAVLTQPSLSALCSVIWIIGAAILVIYGVISFINTKKRLSSSKCDRENIYTCEGLTTPLVVGLIKPKIYLPQHLTGKEKEYILLHEQTHIKHFDPFVKILSFATVCLHWFNPLVWLAYFASEKDMEMCCDEAVIEEIGYDIKKNYSYSLLNFATGRQIIGGMPLAFGEGDTKSRVKNILNYKKPAFWVIVVSTIAIVAVGVGLMTNSASKPIVSPYVQEYIPGQGNIRGNVDVESYEKISPDFAVGAEKYGVAVFKNPHKAFETFEVLYAEGIAYIQKENGLRPLSKNYYEAYKTYGWQMTSGTKEELAQAKFVSGFLDIYENSFLKQYPNTNSAEPTVEAVSPLDYFIMTDEIGAIGCE
ncbi:MAG: M56 family metallopeptidase, partial [Oscillospiraceae bacterium]